jgi:phosphoglycolate phosphatase
VERDPGGAGRARLNLTAGANVESPCESGSVTSTSPIAPARQVVLLDLDGTLSESEPGILGSLTTALTSLQLVAPPYDVMRHAIGPPFESGLPEIGIAAEHVPAVIAAYRTVYEDTGLFDTQLYGGVIDMLDSLAEAGCTLCVATSKPEPSARRVIEHLGLTDRFKVIGGATHDSSRRTKSAVIGHVLDQLGLVGGPELVMVGDRHHDIEGAREHGIDTIAVAWGYGDRAEHEAAGAWAIAEQPADVVGLVLSPI